MSTKAYALDNFWFGIFPKSKGLKIVKTKSENSSMMFLAGVLLVAINVILLGSYIYGVNDYASKGYEIQKLQNTLSALNVSNKQINLQIAQASSMVSIQNDFLSANFVPATTAKFLQVNQFSLNQ
jgi:hypothetical protein